MKKILLIAILGIVTFSSCREIFGRRVRGSGHITSQNRSTGNYNSIDVSGAIDVYVTQDSAYTVKVETDDNLQEYLDVYTDGNVLRIHPADRINFNSSRGVKVYVSGPMFKSLEASGACNYYSQNQLSSSEKIRVGLSGSSDAKLDLNTPRIEADLSGASTLDLKGQTKDFDVQGSGSSDIKCFDLLTENTKIDVSGASDAEVSASLKLEVDASGSSDIKYKGNPTISQSVSGASSIKKVQ